MLVLLLLLLAASSAPAFDLSINTGQDSPAALRPQRMQSLLDNVRSIPGAFAGSTPQVSFVNNPDGTIGFCFQSSPLASDSHGEYCMSSNSSGRAWTDAQQVRSAPIPPAGTKYSAPPSLQWNGRHGAAAAAAALYAFYPLGIYSAGPAAWNGSSFVWESESVEQLRSVWAGENGGGIHGMIRLTNGKYAGRILTQWQLDGHGIIYMYSDDGGRHWTNSTNRAIVEGDRLGGCEPSTVELSNGTLLTFIRTMRTPDHATLWQAQSFDGGGSFSAAPTPTALISFQSPVLVLRVVHSATRASVGGIPPIVLVFNNARPTATSTSGETYRAILHAAISLDDGNTWKGFREVMRDDAMRGSNDENSDHGTAYPEGAAALDGSIIFQSGQGGQHWSAMRFGAEWLLETAQVADWTTAEAVAAWENVTNFDGTYSSGCAAGTPATDLLGRGRVIACSSCTGAEFDPQAHRPAFFQPDVDSSSIKIFAANVLPKCEVISCPSPYGGHVQFNPCTLAHENELVPANFERLQQFNWGNRSGYKQWAADPYNWFNCSQVDISHIRVHKQCSEHDGVSVRPPRLTRGINSDRAGSQAQRATAVEAPARALCAAMDPEARSAGFSWNYPSSHHGMLDLRILLEREGFRGAQIALSDHWEPPWHDRHDPTVSVFVFDIAPSSGGEDGGWRPPTNVSVLDLTLSWNISSAMSASWSAMTTGGVKVASGLMKVTRSPNMTIGAGGLNYVTVKAFGQGGICVATARKADAQ